MRTMLTVLTLTVLVWLPGNLVAGGKGEEHASLQDMQLTDAQEAKLMDLQKEYKPKVQTAAKALRMLVKEEVEKIQGLLTPEQKTTLAALKEEKKEQREKGLCEKMAHFKELDLTQAEMAKVKQIREEFQPKIAEALKGLKDILTAEQRVAREAGLKAGKKRTEIVASLNLTDAQKAKFEAVGKEVATLVREELQKIHTVLTDGQKIKVVAFTDEDKQHARDHKAQMIANLKSLNLTEQQKSEIMAIRKEFHPKIHEAGNALRAVVREEIHAVIGVLKAS